MNTFYKNGMWYWYDETGDTYGPYWTELECTLQTTLYIGVQLEGTIKL